jgi:hypothetical protein
MHRQRSSRRAISSGIGFAVVFAAGLFGPAATTSAQSTDVGAIRTVAGRMTTGDGGPAVLADIPPIIDVTADSGSRAIVLSTDRRIRRVETDGTLSIIAGDGSAASVDTPTTGVPALSALPSMTTIAGLPDGAILVGTAFGGVFRIETSGTLTRWPAAQERPPIGSSGCEFVDDPTTLRVCGVSDVTPDGAGGAIVVERNMNIVMRVAANGVVSRVAGVGPTSNPSSSGDGGPALLASLFGPREAAVVDGTTYVTEYPNRLRRIRPNGLIDTVSNGTVERSGGGSATLFGLYGAMADGRLLFSGGRYLMAYRPSQFADLVLGASSNDPADGGPALLAEVDSGPVSAAAPDGSILSVNRPLGMVYRFFPGSTVQHVAGRLLPDVVEQSVFRIDSGSRIVRATNGAILVAVAGRGELWRYRAGEFARLVGPVRAGLALRPSDGQPIRGRLLDSVLSVASGCDEDWYIGGGPVFRVGPDAVAKRVTDDPADGYFLVGGACGAIFVRTGNGTLGYLGGNDGSFVPVAAGVGSNWFRDDARGGVLYGSVSGLTRTDSFGVSTVVATGDYLDATGAPDGTVFALRQTSSSRAELVRIKPGGQPELLITNSATVVDVPVNGPLGGGPVQISGLAYDPAGFLWVVDGRFLRTIRLTPLRIDAPPASAPTPTPPRTPVPGAPGVGGNNRTPAPAA